MKYVEIDSLYKSFESVAAVENLNLSIDKGEIFGLLGPKATWIYRQNC